MMDTAQEKSSMNKLSTTARGIIASLLILAALILWLVFQHGVINIDPIAFKIGGLQVHWYGIMYVVAITIGLLVVWPYARSKGLKDEQMEAIVAVAVPAGLVGARLYYVIQQPLGPYLQQPWRILAINEGGMAFYGAIFAVVITIIIMTWRMKMPLWRLLDVAVLFAAVGQFWGRIGNIVNGDIVGFQTTLPWGIVWANPGSFVANHSVAYQPAAVYEAIINVIIFNILWTQRNRYRGGVLFFMYIFLYSISQFLIFFVRDNEVIFWGLKQAQLTAIAVMLVAAVGLWWYMRTKQGKELTPTGNPV
jgi:phosphatidylglycerol---prolipoprotein diacylglyceryl transferase